MLTPLSYRKRRVRIHSTGSYLPSRKITGLEIDRKLGWAPGTSTSISGVIERSFADNSETNTSMGAIAAYRALERASMDYEDIDAIIYVSGTQEQLLPCNAALLQRAMGKENSGTPCFDISSTCLSFVTGLDLISYLIEAGRFRNVLLVSSEIASRGLNWNHRESASLFGDAAVAVIVSPAEGSENSGILASRMETYSSGVSTSEILGGGMGLHPRHYRRTENEGEDERFLFSMDGRKAFRMAAEKVPPFLEKLFEGTGLTLGDIQLVVPHQASLSAMELLRRRLGIPTDKFMKIIENHGNVVAASIPLALHEAIDQKKIQRGDKILLLGTSAGLSIGGVLLEY